MVTGGTKFHFQKDTNLCAYFATMSALRHQLRKFIAKYAGIEINEYLEQRDQNEKRFEPDLAVMIGCVCPRALSARFEIQQSFFHKLIVFTF